MSFNNGSKPEVFKNSGQEKDQIDAYRKKVLAEIAEINSAQAELVKNYSSEIVLLEGKRQRLEASCLDYEDKLVIAQRNVNDCEKSISALNAIRLDIQSRTLIEENAFRDEQEKRIAVFKEKESGLVRSIAAYEQRIKDLTFVLADKEKNLARLQETTAKAEDYISELNDKMLVLGRKEDESLSRVDGLQYKASTVEGELRVQRKELSETIATVSRVMAEKDALVEEVKNINKQKPDIESERAANSAMGKRLQGWEADLKIQEKAIANRLAVVLQREKELKEAQARI